MGDDRQHPLPVLRHRLEVQFHHRSSFSAALVDERPVGWTHIEGARSCELARATRRRAVDRWRCVHSRGRSSSAMSPASGDLTKESIMSTSRLQLALNVTDIEAATRFYTDLFGVGPAKQRTGYANFEVADPPLKLVLFENPGAVSPLNHLGRRGGHPGRRPLGGGTLRRRRDASLVHGVGPLLPRRAGQGVGRRSRRPPRRVGVLHRAGRRPRPRTAASHRAPAARRRRPQAASAAARRSHAR